MTAARRHRASRSETPIVGAEGEPGHKQTPSLTTSPSLPLADRTRTIRMMAQAPLGASAPSCFIGTPFISCDSHFSHRRFSRTVIATSRIPTSPINAQSPPAVHILLYNARIVGKRSSCTYTVPRDLAHHSSFRWNSNVSRNSVGVQQWAQSFSTAVVQIPPPYNARIMPFRGSCTRIGVATLRASCAASHSHAGPHRARNEPSGGVNEIRNTTGLSSTIVEPHRHD